MNTLFMIRTYLKVKCENVRNACLELLTQNILFFYGWKEPLN